MHLINNKRQTTKSADTIPAVSHVEFDGYRSGFSPKCRAKARPTDTVLHLDCLLAGDLAIMAGNTAASHQAMHRQRGFSLIRWLILVAVFGVLAVVAFPYFKTHTTKPKFAEVMQAIAPYKAAIEACAKDGSCVAAGTLAGLEVGKLGVPPSISTTYLARVTVSPKGVITATASNAGGLAGETYVLTPILSNSGQIAWAVTGTCKTRDAGAIC